MENLIVELSPNEAERACRKISASLPEWFGIPEANERYAEGVRTRLALGYLVNNICVGMISLEFPFENSANIYWMGVNNDWHFHGIGKALLRFAEIICLKREVYSISVETLSPKENDDNYLKTYRFYTNKGFRPLFELNTYGPEYLMVYLNKVLSPQIFEWVDLTHEISENIPTWKGDCGFKHRNNNDESSSDCKFFVQHIEMDAGIGTHIDAPAHCFQNGKTINDLSLQTLMAPCIVVDVSQVAHQDYCIEMQIIRNFEKKYIKAWKDAFVIFYSGWERFWNQSEQYRNNYNFPSISKEVAEYLVAEDIAGIGIDTLSPDKPNGGFPVHRIVLGAGKYIVENIANAKKMPVIGGFTFIMPIKISNGTEAPIRLIGMYQKVVQL